MPPYIIVHHIEGPGHPISTCFTIVSYPHPSAAYGTSFIYHWWSHHRCMQVPWYRLYGSGFRIIRIRYGLSPTGFLHCVGNSRLPGNFSNQSRVARPLPPLHFYIPTDVIEIQLPGSRGSIYSKNLELIDSYIA